MDQLALPPRLRKVLSTLTDRELLARIERVILAAAQAIDRLSHLNLLKFEPTSADDGTADLALWEQMAPAIRDTVVDVNTLFEAVFAELPKPGRGRAFAVDDTSDDCMEIEIGRIFRATAVKLQDELGEVRGMLGKPELVASRWGLLAELQRLRARFRSRIGDAVYLTAAALAPVRREDVVPGHQQEVTRATTLRTTAADLVRTVEGRLGDTQTPVDKRLLALKVDFESFCSLPAWRYVRATTKQGMWRVRESLEAASGEQGLAELEPTITGVLQALGELIEQQNREVLGAHDREAWNDAGLRLEQVQLHLELDTGGAAGALATALQAATGLYGRDPQLDLLLREARNQPTGELTPGQLRELLGSLRQRLQAMTIF